MKTIAQRFILSVSFAAALLLAGCHLNEEKTAEEVPDAAPISYEYLYDCLWTVADFAENADGLPEMLADPNGAVFFQKAGHTMSVFRKRKTRTKTRASKRRMPWRLNARTVWIPKAASSPSQARAWSATSASNG